MKKNIMYIIFGFVVFLLFGLPKSVLADIELPMPKVEANISWLDKELPNLEVETVNQVTEHKEILNTQLSSLSSGYARKFETTYTVDYTINSVVQPFGTNTGGGENSIVRSSITIVYWFSGGKVKVERVYGKWTPLTSPVDITSRYVTYKGPNVSLTGYHYPSGNSFDYNTGWGYASQNSAGNGRAYMSAYTSISGMGQLFLDAVVNI